MSRHVWNTKNIGFVPTACKCPIIVHKKTWSFFSETAMFTYHMCSFPFVYICLDMSQNIPQVWKTWLRDAIYIMLHYDNEGSQEHSRAVVTSVWAMLSTLPTTSQTESKHRTENQHITKWFQSSRRAQGGKRALGPSDVWAKNWCAKNTPGSRKRPLWSPP